MTDVVIQVAKYLAAATGHSYGEELFYYQMPDTVDTCVVVQRNKSNVHVPVQIDAGYHSVRIAARSTSSDAAYKLAEEMYRALEAAADESASDTPGFINLEETQAQVVLYDAPTWYSQDQQGRKVFDFTASLITKR